MNKQAKVSMISISILIFILSLGTYLFMNKGEEIQSENSITELSKEDSTSEDEMVIIESLGEENKYYAIYITDENNKMGTSFVPKKLNPSFSGGSSYQVRITTDDNGNIINDNGKIIHIKNFVISEENKQKIREIAGEEDYDEALKEIEERVLEAKTMAEQSS